MFLYQPWNWGSGANLGMPFLPTQPPEPSGLRGSLKDGHSFETLARKRKSASSECHGFHPFAEFPQPHTARTVSGARKLIDLYVDPVRGAVFAFLQVNYCGRSRRTSTMHLAHPRYDHRNI